ncbi:MAG: hypothetical protein O6768_09780, partial [Planctomycetota bacterium]|nr:hypothetical protein [Planctomycetota bacterium]
GGPATTFILRPDLAEGVDVSSLDRLQQDLRRIAEFLSKRGLTALPWTRSPDTTSGELRSGSNTVRRA